MYIWQLKKSKKKRLFSFKKFNTFFLQLPHYKTFCNIKILQNAALQKSLASHPSQESVCLDNDDSGSGDDEGDHGDDGDGD